MKFLRYLLVLSSFGQAQLYAAPGGAATGLGGELVGAKLAASPGVV